MPGDEDVIRRTWEGRVPVAFVPAQLSEDLATKDTCYMLLPRMAYLALCSKKVSEHFQHQDGGGSREPWYEYRGQPLKWNYPIGLLFDCLADADEELPWQIVVRFDEYPVEDIIPCPDLQVAENYFINRLKEATCLKHGTAMVEALDNKDNKRRLWYGFSQDDYEQFRKVNEGLMTCKDGHWFKRVPIRIYLVDTTAPAVSGGSAAAAGSGSRAGSRTITLCEEPFNSTSTEGTPHTLHDLLQAVFPDATMPAKVLLHGIQPPLNTPLQWLSENLSYADNFLHFAVFPAQAPSATSAA